MLDDFSKQKKLSSVLDPSKSHRKYLSKKSLLSRHICSQPIIGINRKFVNYKVCLSVVYNELYCYAAKESNYCCPCIWTSIIIFLLFKLRYFWYNQDIVVCQDFLFTLGLNTPTVTRVKIDNIWHTCCDIIYNSLYHSMEQMIMYCLILCINLKAVICF